MNEHDQVVLTQDLPEECLEAGDAGTIVHVFRDGQAYVIEFFALDGETVTVATVEGRDVRPVTPEDVMHARRREITA